MQDIIVAPVMPVSRIPIKYDEIGNLTHFGDEDVGNIYFEWQNGRQLAAITDDYGKEVAYKYDQNGMRTQKVNHDVEDGDSIYDYTYVGSVLVRQTLTEDPADAAPYLAHTLDFIYDAGGSLTTNIKIIPL